MLKSKRLLKLHKKGEDAQNADKGGSDLDDSIEDFIVSRPTKSERKQQKAADSTQSLSIHPGSASHGGSVKSSSEHAVSSASSATSKIENLERISPYFNEQKETDLHIDALSSGRTIPNVQKVTIRKKSSRKGSSRKGFEDPSDMALAIALSESMQMAGEVERQKQEELLLTENLVNVIADLRDEGGKNENLAPIFLKSPPQPVTKVKRRGKNTKKTKDFVLILRTQAERERLIAEQAAAVLNQATETFKGERKPFAYNDPHSAFVKQHQQEANTLWSRTALVSLENIADDMRENFYVAALKSVLSPPKKPGCTKILFHLSQLPGRECSQMDPGGLTATQAILEQLAYAAEGGFVDDPDIQNDQSISSTHSELLQDWSRMIDNPLMSDVRIKTTDKEIHAHRLVFAVRFPQLLDRLVKSSKSELFELDWSDYSTNSALKVLNFIYTAEYVHDDIVAEEVCHICRNFGLRALSERIPNHEQYSFMSLESDAEDVVKPEDEVQQRTATPGIHQNSDSQETVKLNLTDDNESPKQAHPKPLKNESERKQSASVSDIEELTCFAVNSPVRSTANDDALRLNSCVSEQSDEMTDSVFIAATPPGRDRSKTESNGSRSLFSRGSLSPDMFQDTIYDSRCEEAKNSPSVSSDVVDLTQDSDRDRCCSPITVSHHSKLCETDLKKSGKTGFDPCAMTTGVKEKEDAAIHNSGSAIVQKDSFLDESSFVLSSQNSSNFLSRTLKEKPTEKSSPQNHENLAESSFIKNLLFSDPAKILPNESTRRFPQKPETNSSHAKNKKNSVSSEILSKAVTEISPVKSLNSSIKSFEDDNEDLAQSQLKDQSVTASPVKNAEDSFSTWENCNDGLDPAPYYPSPGTYSPLRNEPQQKADMFPCGTLELRQNENTFTSPSLTRSTDRLNPTSQKAPRRSQKSKASDIEDMQTPENDRLSKKRKVDITPLPDYQTMDTPGLKKELDKFGLKPMKRKNAVKLLNHIYEELHPYVTDTESSSQDSPKRNAGEEAPRRQSASFCSPPKHTLDRSSQESGEDSAVEDEESVLVAKMDRQNSHSPSNKAKQSVPLANQMKQFFRKRPELYKQVLTYEPIEFEYLYKEARKDGVRCKAQELLNWLDEQCITCRMNARNPSRKGKSQSGETSLGSPDNKVAEKQARSAQGSRVAKKLIS